MEESAIELPKIARDAAYTVIGLGILAVQAGQVTRRRLGIRSDPIAAINGFVQALLANDEPAEMSDER